MRNLALLAAVVSMFAAACGDEASAMRGSWQISRLTIGFAENLDCAAAEEQETENAGTMTFDDVPHPDGLGDRTFTYALTQVPDVVTGELVEGDPALEGVAAWEPDDGKEDTAGFQVTDPENESMGGLWNILESAFGAVSVEHVSKQSIPDEGDRCIRSEYFLVAL